MWHTGLHWSAVSCIGLKISVVNLGKVTIPRLHSSIREKKSYISLNTNYRCLERVTHHFLQFEKLITLTVDILFLELDQFL